MLGFICFASEYEKSECEIIKSPVDNTELEKTIET